jgi:hypothetical protein
MPKDLSSDLPFDLRAPKLILGESLTIYTPHDLGRFQQPKEEYGYQTAGCLNIRLNY